LNKFFRRAPLISSLRPGQKLINELCVLHAGSLITLAAAGEVELGNLLDAAVEPVANSRTHSTLQASSSQAARKKEQRAKLENPSAGRVRIFE
jgi:hypothetical protein